MFWFNGQQRHLEGRRKSGTTRRISGRCLFFNAIATEVGSKSPQTQLFAVFVSAKHNFLSTRQFSTRQYHFSPIGSLPIWELERYIVRTRKLKGQSYSTSTWIQGLESEYQDEFFLRLITQVHNCSTIVASSRSRFEQVVDLLKFKTWCIAWLLCIISALNGCTAVFGAGFLIFLHRCGLFGCGGSCGGSTTTGGSCGGSTTIGSCGGSTTIGSCGGSTTTGLC